jgi:general secretion pathway protein E
VAHYVNGILLEAVKRGASTSTRAVRRRLAVRYRIDGLLYDQPPPPAPARTRADRAPQGMAKLDLAEKRLPQAAWPASASSRAKSTCACPACRWPKASASSCACCTANPRASRSTSGPVGRPARGIPRILRAPHGIVLVTGPTGSGKTTTLYAALASSTPRTSTS